MYCSDTWRKPIPENKLMAYQELMRNGTITIQKVIYNKTTKITEVHYEAIIPHDEVLAQMKKFAARYMENTGDA